MPRSVAIVNPPKGEIGIDFSKEELIALLKLHPYVPKRARELDLYLYKFQIEGVNEMLRSPSQHVYNGDVMGIGKTVQALVFANLIAAHRLLVVCTASLRLNWLREAYIWYCLTKAAGHAILSKHDLHAITKKLWVDKGFMPSPLIVSYDMLVTNPELFKYIRNREWDLTILDEADAIRNPYTKRANAVVDIWQNCSERVCCLSGTPMANAAIDLYTPLSQIVPILDYVSKENRELCSDYDLFAGHFCYKYLGQYGIKYQGVRHADQLKNLLRKEGRFFTRRTKEQVKIELPEKSHTRIDLDLKIKYKLAEHLSGEALDAYADAVAREDRDAISKKEKAYGTIKRELGESKAACKDAIEFIGSILTAGRPVVIFFYHTVVRDMLRTALKKKFKKLKIVVHDGKTSSFNKEAAVQDFQRGDADIFLAQVEAAVGYTVTRASDAVFVEYSQLSTKNDQACDRLHRIGQKNPVNYWWLVANDEFDRKMVKNMIKKDKNIRKVMGDEDEAEVEFKVSAFKKKKGKRPIVDTTARELGKSKLLELIEG